MNNEKLISFGTAFLIAGGGAMLTALVGDAAPTKWQALTAVIFGLVAGAKDVRSLMKLPPLVVLLACVWLTSGCVTSKRLEAGGAYAQSATQSAMPELFLTDSTFDVAYAALDVPFKTERANRQLFWAISPNIKHGLDKIRTQANQVNRDYARAREVYLANPVPGNLAPMQEAIAKLNSFNTAALVVIQTKGKQ